jgi:cytochrome c oxidase subunit 2
MAFTVVGRQWMWKIQHPDGHREINEIHLPVGRAVKFTLTSEDVIHDMFVPAMRVKTDVIPGRYTTLWFKPDTVGSYHLFCAQYCGAEHSKMVGRVIVMEPQEYEAWLAGTKAGLTPELSGRSLFTKLACNSCHRNDSATRAPLLAGIVGRRIALASGGSIVADDAYIRESIVDPMAKVTAGYQPMMPTYKGQLTEEQILELVAYVRSMRADVPTSGPALPKEQR